MGIGKLLIATFVSFFLFNIGAFACSCGEVTISSSRKAATVVFSGKIIQKVKSDLVEKDGVEVTFQVDRVWKGVVGSTIKIYSGATSDLYDFMDSCSPLFGIGDRYLVFAEGNKILTNVYCSHTARINSQISSKAILDQLGRGKRPTN
jgi:hypothetical protein